MPDSSPWSDRFAAELERLSADPRREVAFLERIDSTSTELKRRLDRGAGPGTVVAAGCQDAGRGRRGNRWHSPAGGNLYLSLAVPIGADGQPLALLPLAAGVAVRDAVEAAAPVGSVLKWPNDLLARGRKLAGILCEAPGASGRFRAAIVGLGVNLRSSGWEGDLAGIAVGLDELVTDPPEPALLAARWVAGLEAWLSRLVRGETGALVAAWRERAEPFGRQVRVGDLEGRTADLAPDGRLVLITDRGERRIVSGGVVEPI